ncbi:MAG TPA: DoxX family protein [Gammaproteobacteria bacterium]|jgi:putative oxidoreductase|nr:DoxX family protein [Gammaproteobacteria bacterium]
MGTPWYQATLARWAPLPLRLIVGYGFMMHGYLKLERGADVFVAALDGLGLPLPELMAWLTIAVELLGGLAVLAGAYVALASVPMAIVLFVAIAKVHWAFGFSSIKFLEVTAAGPQFGKPGIECDLIYLACLAALVMGGAGPWSFDGRRRAAAGAAPRLARGAIAGKP